MPWRLRTGPHLLVLDAGAAGVVTAAYLALAGQGGSDGLPRFAGPAWLGWLAALCVGAPLAVRRLWPLPAFAAVLGGTAAATLLDITRDPYLSPALALYAVALLEPTRRAAWALALSLLVSAGAVLAGEAALTPSGPWPEAAGTAGFVWLAGGAAWAAGRIVRERRLLAARRERRLAEEALAGERLRIARELHDIVSHSLSVIVVKAAVANHVAGERPGETRDALRAIEATGREALSEMRRALGMLRGGTAGGHTGSAGSAETAPPPGVADLPALVRRAAEAGIRATLRTRLSGPLPAGTALAVHRIVQEALTNVIKHAGDGARCEVVVAADDRGGVRIEVVDDGAGNAALPGRAELGGGHGLVGMRERVMMYGGTLGAGPRPGGGFAVSARLPAASASAPPATTEPAATEPASAGPASAGPAQDVAPGPEESAA
ncbi:sensor histidine kinase [Streptomyces hoynatensis]|nr:sensor histidine kinase [Streptomyces hoynatensis]